jgi:hypothetical protein
MLTEIINEKGNIELSAYYTDYDQFKERLILFESLGYKIKTTISMLTKIATANIIKCKNTIDIRDHNKNSTPQKNINDNKQNNIKIKKIVRIIKKQKIEESVKNNFQNIDIKNNINEIEKLKIRITNVADAVNGIYYNLNALTELVKELVESIEKTNLDILNIENENITISKKIENNKKYNSEKIENKEKTFVNKKTLEIFSSEDFDELIDQNDEQITENEYGNHINWRNLLYSDNSDSKNFNN